MGQSLTVNPNYIRTKHFLRIQQKPDLRKRHLISLPFRRNYKNPVPFTTANSKGKPERPHGIDITKTLVRLLCYTTVKRLISIT